MHEWRVHQRQSLGRLRSGTAVAIALAGLRRIEEGKEGDQFAPPHAQVDAAPRGGDIFERRTEHGPLQLAADAQEGIADRLGVKAQGRALPPELVFGISLAVAVILFSTLAVDRAEHRACRRSGFIRQPLLISCPAR